MICVICIQIYWSHVFIIYPSSFKIISNSLSLNSHHVQRYVCYSWEWRRHTVGLWIIPRSRRAIRRDVSKVCNVLNKTPVSCSFVLKMIFYRGSRRICFAAEEIILLFVQQKFRYFFTATNYAIVTFSNFIFMINYISPKIIFSHPSNNL